jgi:hypothetical protein
LKKQGEEGNIPRRMMFSSRAREDSCRKKRSVANGQGAEKVKTALRRAADAFNG